MNTIENIADIVCFSLAAIGILLLTIEAYITRRNILRNICRCDECKRLRAEVKRIEKARKSHESK